MSLEEGGDLAWEDVSVLSVRAAVSGAIVAETRPADAAARTQRRRLQQASACTASVGGTTTSYGACATLQGLPSAFKLYYSYVPSTRTVEGAFAYPNLSGWVAWGINPGQPGQMLGGSAFIVKSNASAASGEGHPS